MLISAVTNKVGGSLFLLAAGINYQLLALWREKGKKINVKHKAAMRPWAGWQIIVEALFYFQNPVSEQYNDSQIHSLLS